MNDPWKYIAFPVASIAGYLISLGVTSQFSVYTGMTEFMSRITVIGLSGFFAGFMVDEVIPAYVEKVRNSSGGSGSDFGGGGDLDDLDLG